MESRWRGREGRSSIDRRSGKSSTRREMPRARRDCRRSRRDCARSRSDCMRHRRNCMLHRRPMTHHRWNCMLHRRPVTHHRRDWVLHRRPMTHHRRDWVLHRRPMTHHRRDWMLHRDGGKHQRRACAATGRSGHASGGRDRRGSVGAFAGVSLEPRLPDEGIVRQRSGARAERCGLEGAARKSGGRRGAVMPLRRSSRGSSRAGRRPA